MDKYIINGGKKLSGSVIVPSAKNAYLALLAACMLTDQTVVLHKVPNFSDIEKMLEILASLGCKIKRQNDTVIIDAGSAYGYEIPQYLAKDIRSSIFLLGPLLARFKKAKVSYPGGCEIGARPIDLHLKGLRDLNIEINENEKFIECDAGNFKSADISLAFASVGATENLMMAAVLGRGITRITNAAKEPEIEDLANFINKLGGKISGAGTDTIIIEGVKKLHGAEYTAIPDRIIAGTYLIAVAACGGSILLQNVVYEHIYSLVSKLEQSSCKISYTNDKLSLVSDGRLKSFGTIETQVYPGFATDLQAQAMVLQAVSEGTCEIFENLFETRFKHVPELIKMGANIQLSGQKAIVTGVKGLKACEVTCSDLRGGAALTIAGLAAKGTTIVNGVGHIERGYENLENVFTSLGADIKKLT